MTIWNWKAVARTAIASLYYYSGLFAWHLRWRRRSRKSVLILTFHRVLPAGDKVLQEHRALRSIVVTEDHFTATIDFLQMHFKFLALPGLPGLAQNGEARHAAYCIITFDDGYYDFLKFAWPVLQPQRIPVTLFVPTALVGTSHSFWWDEVYCLGMNLQQASTHEAPHEIAALLAKLAATPTAQRPHLIYELIEAMQDWPQSKIEHLRDSLARGAWLPATARREALLNWEEIQRLHQAGVEIGSHTRQHLNLKVASPEALHTEIAVSKRELDEIMPAPVTSFSFPGGHISEQALAEVAQAGYAVACSTNKGMNRPGENLYRLLRVNVWDGMMQNFRGNFSPALLAFHLMRN